MSISDPIRTAAVGMGFGAREAGRLQADAAMELVKVCDLDEQRARQASDKLGVPHTLSLDEVLADSTIEAIALFTQPRGRGRLLERLAEAGKHIVTTKPFERSVADAEAAIAAIDRAGVVAIANSPPPRYLGAYALARQAIEAGHLSLITTANAFTWSDYGPTEPNGSWYDDPEACPVAPIYRLGIYMINLFNVFLGRPVSVSVQEGRVQTRRPTSDIASAAIQYESGTIATITASLSIGGPAYPNMIQIGGPDGVFQINPALSGSEILWHTVEKTESLGPDEPMDRSERDVGIYDYEGFYRMVRHGEQPEIPLATAVDGVRVMVGLYRASQERRTIDL